MFNKNRKKFVEVHDFKDGHSILVALNKAEAIDSNYILFQGFTLHIKESLEELKAML